jgi:hypothetical protein
MSEMDHVPPPSIDEALEEMIRHWIEIDDGSERMYPYLHLFTGDGKMVICALALENGRQFAACARALVLLNDPVVAVIGTEGWGAAIDPRIPTKEQPPGIREWLERREELQARLDRGERVEPSEWPGVRDLPPDVRYDTASFFAEDREGQSRERHYIIRPNPAGSGPRVYEVQDLQEGKTESRFRPLFAVQAMARKGVPGEIARLAILREMEMCGLSENTLRQAVQDDVARTPRRKKPRTPRA